MRTCRDCGCTKEDQYFINNVQCKDGIDTLCKLCNIKRVKKWRKENPERRAIQSKKEGKSDYCHNKVLKATYGINREDYVALFDKQQGCCKICGKHQLNLTRRLSVDHCHTTGKIRGLLCGHCNTLLGMAKDKVEVLEKAINYLQTGY